MRLNAAERSGIQRDAAGCSGMQRYGCHLERWLGDKKTSSASRARDMGRYGEMWGDLPLLGRGAGRSSRPQKAERYESDVAPVASRAMGAPAPPRAAEA